MSKIKNILLKKMNESKLSHLVTFQTENPTANAFEIKQFVLNLAGSFVGLDETSENFLNRVYNHADLLIIGENKKEETNYVSEELSEIYSFLNHNALEAKAKIIIIQNAHLLNDLHSNKLLKVFEEPPIAAYFFLLNPKGKKLLSTIESRSIKINIDLNQKNENHDQDHFYDVMLKCEFASFVELVQSSSDFQERAFYELLAINMTKECKTVEDAEISKNLLKSLEKAFEFRLPMATRLSHAYFDAKKVLRF